MSPPGSSLCPVRAPHAHHQTRAARTRWTALLAACALPTCTLAPTFGNNSSPASNPRPLPDGRCNALALGAPVQPVQVREPYPAPVGGAIAGGSYRLTAYTLYRGDAPPRDWPGRAIALVIAGNDLHLASMQVGGEPTTAQFRIRTEGTTLEVERVCGTATPSISGYDASPEQLRIHVEVPDGHGIWTLLRHDDAVAAATPQSSAPAAHDASAGDAAADASTGNVPSPPGAPAAAPGDASPPG